MNTQRHASIDQFRGFAILSMILVNILGRYPVMPDQFRHEFYAAFNFADAVQPFFIFIVGLGFRISFLKNATGHGEGEAMRIALKRYLVLLAVSVFVYHFDKSRLFWDALTLIGFSGLLAIPIIGKDWRWRIVISLLYASLFPLTGSVFEPFGWTFLLIAGSFAADWICESNQKLTTKTARWGISLFLVGWILALVLSREFLFVAYGLIYTGLSFLLLTAFHYFSEISQISAPHLTTFGRNALVVYILHFYIEDDLKKIIPDNVGITAALSSFMIVYLGCYAIARYLEKRNYFITI